MIVFHVGQPFPQPLPPHTITSIRPFGGGLLLLHKTDRTFTPEERADLGTELTINIDDPHWPILRIEHRYRLGMTVSVNLLDQSPEQKAAFLSAQGLVQVVYVQIHDDDTVRRVRVFTLPAEMSRVLRRAAEDVAARAPSAELLHQAMERVMDRPRPRGKGTYWHRAFGETPARVEMEPVSGDHGTVRQIARHVLGRFGVWPVPPCPAPLPEALALWHVYTSDGGHSVLCLLAQHEAEALASDDASAYLVPVPVNALLGEGTPSWRTANAPGLPVPVPVAMGLTYSSDMGLVTDAPDLF